MSVYQSQLPGNVTLQGKKDFADVINKDLEMGEIILDYPGGPRVITRGVIREGHEGQSQGSGCDYSSRGHSDGRKGPRKEMILPQNLQKECNPDDNLILAQTSDLHKCRLINVFFLSPLSLW